MKKETFRKYQLTTNKGRVFTEVVAKDPEQAKAIINTYLSNPCEWIAKVLQTGLLPDCQKPTKTLTEQRLNVEILKDLKEGSLNLCSSYSSSLYTGYAEYEKGKEYIGVNFEYDYRYKRIDWDILPVFSVTITSIYDYEGDEYTNLDDNLLSLIEKQLEDDINDCDDLDRWIDWGVDEDRLHFEDDTPAYPITL